MKIILVGSKGYIGSHLEKHLMRSGNLVVGIDCDSDCMQQDSGFLSIDYVLPSDCDAVIYLAQSPHYRRNNEKPAHLLTVNVLNALRFAELAVKAGVRRYIYASTGNVCAPSFSALTEDSSVRLDNWYSLSKVQAEQALDRFRQELDLTIVRPFGIYGPNQPDRLISNLLESIYNRRDILLDLNPMDANDHDGLRISLCYIDDVVRMLVGLLVVSNVPVINIAGDEVLSIRDIASNAANFMGIEPKLVLTERPREFDLIADTRYLKEVLHPTFTTLAEGLNATIKAQYSLIHSNPAG